MISNERMKLRTMDPPGAAPLVTADWVAWYLGTTRARVYQMCMAGLIPHTRLGRALRFSLASIVAWSANGGSDYPGGWRKEVVE
jgi:excisionase family DNA binding protein